MNQNKKYLEKLHDDILLIMDEIDRVCQQNNLKYYLIGGTLLGAVRHKGFIPWDDDLDIVMPREDMEKLIEISAKALRPGFHLEWISTNPGYWYIFPKICLNNTIFDEGYSCKTKMGIFVDIFPLDKTSSYTKKLDAIKKVLLRYHYISSSNKAKKNSMKKIFYWICSFFISNKICYALQRKVCISASKLGNSHFANFGSQYNIKKQTMPIEWYDEGVLVDFEGRKYYAPSKYKNVLESIFGKNYMQLPPIDKRRSHYPSQVIFSDGEIMNFETPKNRVSVDKN